MISGISLHSNYLQQYHKDNATREKWDFLQSRMRCCGLRQASGYNDYLNIGEPNGYRFPDSCCHDYRAEVETTHCSKNYPKSQITRNTDELAQRIYVRGCLDILKHLYEARDMAITTE